MSLNNAERERLQKWAATVRTASTWHSGPKAAALKGVADEITAVAEGETTARELQQTEAEEQG